MAGEFIVFGAPGSGSVAVEAALTLLGAPYRLEERGDWSETAQSEDLAKLNPMRQIPAVVLPSGELMTESAAILTYIADAHPESGLSPTLDSPLRPRFLRWMSFISAQIYSLYWIRDVPSRMAADAAHEAVVKARAQARIAEAWRTMGEQAAPVGRFMLGDEISVLDIYMAVVSRWGGPRRKGFYEIAPRLAPVVKAVDAEPRLAAHWAARFPFSQGWEG